MTRPSQNQRGAAPARTGWRRLWLAPLALLLAAASGDTVPQVILAVPGTGGAASDAGGIDRFTLRFSAAMVPLGDPRAPAPARHDCPAAATARWVDDRSFVLEFAAALPGGIACSVTLADNLRTLDGALVGGNRNFAIDTGGPAARTVMAGDGGDGVEEDQIFLVATNVAADPASIAAHGYCAVDGIGEKIPLDVQPARVAESILAGLSPASWQRQDFLANAGQAAAMPPPGADRASWLSRITAVKCRRPLPPGRDMALIWDSRIAQLDAPARTVGRDQRFDYRVRPAFAASLTCSRVNPKAGCSPISPIFIRFTAPVERRVALAASLRLANGQTVAADDDGDNDAHLTRVRFAGPFADIGMASAILPADLTDQSGRALDGAGNWPVQVAIDPAPPLVKFAAPFGIVEAAEGGVLPVTVRAVEPALVGRRAAVTGRAAQVADDDAAVLDWLRRVDRADDYDMREEADGRGGKRQVNYQGAASIFAGASPGGAAQALTLELPGKGKDFEVVGIPLATKGLHIVELESPALGAALLGRPATRYVAAAALVTNISVHFKWGRENALVWLTALDSGQPVAGADVRVNDGCTGRELARGRSDASGRLVVTAALPPPATYSYCEDGGAAASAEDRPLMVSARLGDDYSFTLTDWSEGIRPTDFDLPFGWSERQPILHTIFDRALVKAGERVEMKHIARRAVGTGFAISPAMRGTLRLAHRGSDTQFDLPFATDASGIGTSGWDVPRAAPQGDYDLSFILPGAKGEPETIWSDQSVRVDEYRLPTMTARITGPPTPPVRPASVALNLFAGFLAGGPAPGLAVTVRTSFQPAYDAPDGYAGWSFGGRAVRAGTAPLDDAGDEPPTPLPLARAAPLSLGEDGTAATRIMVDTPIDEAAIMLAEMDYPDANGEILTARRAVRLFPAAVQLGVKSDGWIMRGDDVRLKLVALDLAGKPVAGQRVQVELFQRTILTARRRLIGGFYAYDNQVETKALSARCSARTDAKGLAACTMAPGVSGEVIAVATTRDASGHVARSVHSLWLAGADEQWFGGDNGDRMDVIAEAPSYAAGATARVQVRMPFREATALVTVEREGILSSFVTQLSGRDPVVAVKLPAAYAPEVYISVMAVRGRVSGTEGWFTRLKRALGFRVDGGAGPPTALVDLAKPAYRLGITRVKVGREGSALAVKLTPDKASYAVRETAQLQVAVTAPGGQPPPDAEIAFVAVDEALLALAPNPSWDVLEAMMGQRTLDVITATGQMQVVGKRHYGRKALAAGGGGGGDLSGLTRTDFRAVLLWRGRVPLDGAGRARIAVPLSDNLSAFRMVAVATAGAGRFGTGEVSVRTVQDLAVFASLPELVRSGDRYDARFTLRNGTDAPMTVTATPRLMPAVATAPPLTVTIKPGGAAPISWAITAPSGVPAITWTIAAASADGRARDRLEFTQTIAPAVPMETWAASLLQVGSDTALRLAPPAGALPGSTVDIRLTASPAPPLAGVRAWLADYPYACFEQQASQAIGLADRARWDALMASLPTYLASDGLLNYFPGAGAEGSAELTAYVLAVAAAADYPLPAEPRSRMIAALGAVVDGRLARALPGPSDSNLVRMAALAALARQGAATPAHVANIAAITAAPAALPTSTLADWLTTVDLVPALANAPALRAAAEAELRRRIVVEGTRLDLTDAARAPWWMMVSGDEMAIKLLDAVLGRAGWGDDAGRLMAGIAARQQRGRWDTTPANAWGSIVVRRFAAAYPAAAISGTTTASIGSASAAQNWPIAADEPPLRLPLRAAAPLALAHRGGGTPWAVVSVSAAVPLTQPLAAGYRIKRSISVVSAAKAGQFTRGDVIKVRIEVTASAGRNWVAIADPIPPGATIIGKLGGQSELLAAAATSSGTPPSYTERDPSGWRAYYRWLEPGTHVAEYVVRLNGTGQFSLPPTRVEAMYSPEIRGQWPNAPITIAAGR